MTCRSEEDDLTPHTYPEGFSDWPLERRNAFFAAEAEAYRERSGNDARRWRAERDATVPIIKATRFSWIDPATIPRRKWLYGHHYVRDFVSETIAVGAVGKSSLAIVEGLAIVTGRALLGVTPDEQTNVWYWNGEDPKDELQRRIAAAAIHYEILPSEIEARLFVDSGRETKIVVAEQTRTGAVVARPVVDAVIATIKRDEIGLMTVDPFVASHRVVENDNPAIELVAAAWAEIADELVHHARKTNGAEITVDDGRGGSALLAKVRSARVLNGVGQRRKRNTPASKSAASTSALRTVRRTSRLRPRARTGTSSDLSSSGMGIASASSRHGSGQTPSMASASLTYAKRRQPWLMATGGRTPKPRTGLASPSRKRSASTCPRRLTAAK